MNTHPAETLWLFDLGNTSLKGRWSRGTQAGPVLALYWDAADLAGALQAGLAGWPEPARVLVASVAAERRAARLRAALQRWPAAPVAWLTSPRRACGITNAYRRPARLGIDRFLAMVGARLASKGAPFVLAGCGTAVTLDAVDAAGVQQAGLIVPSPELMVRSLLAGTAIAEGNPDAFATPLQDDPDDTRRAIRSGCQAAVAALVGAYHARHHQLAATLPLWLHGGGADALKAALDAGGGVTARVLEDAVWRGMEAWAAAPPDAPVPA